MTSTRTYNSRLRQEQAEATRERILQAVADISDADGLDAVTNRAVAARAGVTEITVYRHFPNRAALMQELWAFQNRRAAVTVGLPERASDIIDKIAPLFETFEAQPGYVSSTLRTDEGRKVRESLNGPRQEAFLGALAEVAGELSEPEQRKAAAILQLLYSAYSWISLREQWDLKGQPAADAVAWAAETLLADLRQRGAAPLKPAGTGASRKKEPAE